MKTRRDLRKAGADGILRTYREQAEAMLDRWGTEVSEGEGQPNVLARLDVISDGHGGGAPGAMFSPMAERADAIMQDIRHIDPHAYKTLLLRALGFNIEEMVKSSGLPRRQVEWDIEEGLGLFQMGIYCRSRIRYWQVDQQLRT